MKTVGLIILGLAIISLVSSIWIGYYAKVAEKNRKLKVENEWLIEDRAQALLRASQAWKERNFWISEANRRGRNER